MNVAQHRIVNLFKTFFFVSVCVFNVWPKTTLPVWPRDAKRLDTSGWIMYGWLFEVSYEWYYSSLYRTGL